MMSKIQPEQTNYYGASYKGSLDFAEATARIQEKVKKYYQEYLTEFIGFSSYNCILDSIPLKDFVHKFLINR